MPRRHGAIPAIACAIGWACGGCAGSASTTSPDAAPHGGEDSAPTPEPAAPVRAEDARLAAAVKAATQAALQGPAARRRQATRDLLSALPTLHRRIEEEFTALLADPGVTGLPRDRTLSEAADGANALILQLGRDWPDAWPLLTEGLRIECQRTRRSCAISLAQTLSGERERIWSALNETPPAGVAELLAAILPPRNRLAFRDEDEPPPDRPMAVELALDVLLRHPNAVARAVSLGLLLGKDAEKYDDPLDLDLLRQRFEQDRNPVLRCAALRLAGFIGAREGNLDLRAIVLAEEDPTLLLNAIEARNLWSQELGFEAFELCDGVVCDWLPRKPRPGSPWSDEEASRLEDLLRRERESSLRDAASGALAERHRNREPWREKAAPGLKVGLKVHEWGVWLDEGGTLTPPQALLADLPAFVHRSEVTAFELWNERSYSPMAVSKPVVYFYAAEPISLLVKVGFFEGRPWTFFPRATDYEASRVYGTEVAREPQPFRDRPGISPPWLEQAYSSQQQLDEAYHFPFRGLPTAGRRAYYRGSPWTYPGDDRVPRRTGRGSVVFTGMGLEWCGLRVGFPEDLEPAAPRPAAPTWTAGGSSESFPGAARDARRGSPRTVARSSTRSTAPCGGRTCGHARR